MTTPLWAPWRMEYILGQNKAPGCFMCAHPNDEGALRANLVLLVQPHAFVCLNRYPFTTSHLLVIPRRHVADPTDLEADEYAALMTLLRETIARLRKAVTCEGMNVGFNLGKAAGAGVADHLHGHVVPRWNGDTNFMPVLADVRVMAEHLDDSWRRLYPAFADLPGVRAPDPGPAT
jgi:ATP adenylyltransferase